MNFRTFFPYVKHKLDRYPRIVFWVQQHAAIQKFKNRSFELSFLSFVDAVIVFESFSLLKDLQNSICTTILPFEHCRNHDEPQLFEQLILSIHSTRHAIEILMINMSIFCNKMTSMGHRLKINDRKDHYYPSHFFLFLFSNVC